MEAAWAEGRYASFIENAEWLQSEGGDAPDPERLAIAGDRLPLPLRLPDPLPLDHAARLRLAVQLFEQADQEADAAIAHRWDGPASQGRWEEAMRRWREA